MAAITTRAQAEAFCRAVANNQKSQYLTAALARNSNGTIGAWAQLKENFSRPDGGGQWVFVVDDA